MRLLFCLANSAALNGANKILFQLIANQIDAGHRVDIFSFGEPPGWCDLKAHFLSDKNVMSIAQHAYDLVFICNGFMIPLILPHVGKAKPVYICQNYDSFCYGDTYETLMAESPAFAQILQLPVTIIATSRSIQTLLKNRTGQSALFMPCAIDKSLFYERPILKQEAVKRILMVGNYTAPFKGFSIGFQALERLQAEMAIQLILITQNSNAVHDLCHLPFPVEVHHCPPQETIADIYASCHVYCCPSLYEGLGLPAIEAFHCGVPVVSAWNFGVSDYGVHEHNLLLAEPNDAASLYAQLKRLLSDASLAAQLRYEGLKTVKNQYDWLTSFSIFNTLCQQILLSAPAAQPISQEAMAILLAELEEEGFYTPFHVLQAYRDMEATLTALCQQMVQHRKMEPAWRDQIKLLQSQMTPFLSDIRKQYFPAFRKEYDLCHLLLAFHETDMLMPFLTARL